jgi:hypothetical protein
MTYTVERIRWSILLGKDTHYRLTYLRTWMPDQQLWRDFLLRAEEIRSSGASDLFRTLDRGAEHPSISPGYDPNSPANRN